VYAGTGCCKYGLSFHHNNICGLISFSCLHNLSFPLKLMGALQVRTGCHMLLIHMHLSLSRHGLRGVLGRIAILLLGDARCQLRRNWIA
jgi:hypothetical protein